MLEGILLAGLGSAEIKIILVIFRQTYGWSRKEAEISISFFERLTSLSRRHVVRAIRILLGKGLISRSTGAKMKYGQPVYKYVINKQNCCQKDTRTITKRTPEPIGKGRQSFENKKKNTLKTKKKTKSSLRKADSQTTLPKRKMLVNLNTRTKDIK